MESLQIRKIGLIPLEDRTEEDKNLYIVYTESRDNVTGSMEELQKRLKINSTEFYTKLDTDVKFREAVLQGYTDGRTARLLEIESALVRLAVGTTVTETRTGVDANGEEVVATSVKEIAPNLQAIMVLLEKMQGSTWKVSNKVDLGDDAVTREVDYKILTKAQLKKLAGRNKNE